jgi:hypothetical protein
VSVTHGVLAGLSSRRRAARWRIKRKRAFYPVVKDILAVGESLTKHLKDLGLDRKAREIGLDEMIVKDQEQGQEKNRSAKGWVVTLTNTGSSVLNGVHTIGYGKEIISLQVCESPLCRNAFNPTCLPWDRQRFCSPIRRQ